MGSTIPRLSLAVVICISSAFAGDAEKPFGLEKRVLWTASKVVGIPDPPTPYQTQRVFPNLKLDSPIEVCQPLSGGRFYVCEQSSRIVTFENSPDAAQADLCLDLTPKDAPRNRIPMGMTFHPRFAENGLLYVLYSDNQPQPIRVRVSRFQVDLKKNPPVADLASEFLIIEWPSPVDHRGGGLRFGPDGLLYISAGDGGPPNDGFMTGQDLSDLGSSIMRVNVDVIPPGRSYGIPPDNPFLNQVGARPEIYAYGLRNVWRMSFDRQTGDFWAGDVGQDLWESVIKIEKGGNYGWSVMEGTHAFDLTRKRGPTPILPPVLEYNHTQGRSLTGGYVYRGRKRQELHGVYIYGDYETGRVWGLRHDGAKVTWSQELVDTPLRVVSFCEDQNGEVLIVDHTGGLYEIVPAPPPDPNQPPFPRLLSQTGLFASVKDHTPAAGLIPYSVNAALWSDGAHKDRFLAMPGEAKIKYNASRDRWFFGWHMPNGTVLVKTFSLDMETGNPASRKRLETRLLHHEQGDWFGYTYLWNDEQTEATLLENPNGLDRKLTVKDAAAPGGVREQVWHFPSRAECTLCHTRPAGFALGMNTLQMNRDHNYGGVTDNQLRAFDHIGLFAPPLKNYYKPDQLADIGARLPHLVDPDDPKQPLDLRARSYLQGNCAHCHMKWGGGNSDFTLSWVLSFKENLLDRKPRHGDWGLTDPHIVARGAASRSMLPHRMAATGATRMPRIGSNVVDAVGVKLIREWIDSLPPEK